MVCALLPTVLPGNPDQSWEAWHRGIASGKTRGVKAAAWRLTLWGASFLYSTAVRVRNFFYRIGIKKSHSAKVPVICVGNLTTGGTGKTPCVEWVANQLRSRGLGIALLSRGYGGAGGVNDEALVLENKLPDVPHLQGPDRLELARTAVEELESEVILLDDGFQHLKLKRDVDLVLVDASNPWGYGHLLPRGTLREPISGLARAQAIVISRADQVNSDSLAAIHNRIKKLAPAALVAEARHKPVRLLVWDQESQPLHFLAGKKVLAFCGIGNPGSFFHSLEELGAQVLCKMEFPDHHPYCLEDIEAISQRARENIIGIETIVTTEKDFVKIRVASLEGLPLVALSIEFDIFSGRENLEKLLARIGQ